MQPQLSEGGARATIIVIDPLTLRRAEVVAFLSAWAAEIGVSVLGTPSLDEADEIAAARLVVLNVGEAGFRDAEELRRMETLRSLAPEVPVVLLSDRVVREEVVAAFKAGMRGFIPTSTEPKVALRALAFIMNGGSFFPPTALLEPRAGDGSGHPPPQRSAPGSSGTGRGLRGGTRLTVRHSRAA